MRRGGEINICGNEVNVFIKDDSLTGRSLTCSYSDLLESRITVKECDLKYVQCIEDARKYWEKEYQDKIAAFSKEQAWNENQIFNRYHAKVNAEVRKIRNNKIEEAARELLSIKMGWEN